MFYGRHCVPNEITALSPQVTIFGDWGFKEVTKTCSWKGGAVIR